MREPQNYDGAYPLAGARIGPAWREMWATMCRKGCLPADFEDVRIRHDLAPSTIRGMLRRGAAAGVLSVTYRRERVNGRMRNRAYFRVSRVQPAPAKA